VPYLVGVRDRPGCEQIRKTFEGKHLDYLDSRVDVLLGAGALLSDDGRTPQGGLFLLDVDDRSVAEQFIAQDPFLTAGLFEIVQVTRWRKGYFAKERLV